MKARVCLVASALLFAGQAWAENSMTPKSDPGLPAPAPAATEPAPAPAPQTEAATPAPAPAPQQQAEVPAEVVITELTAVDETRSS